MVENIVSNNNLPEPKIAVVNSRIPNAFVTGDGHHSSVVAVTKGLLEILDQEELEGVLAHELTRIKNRDVMVMTLASLFSTKAWQMMQFGFFGGMYGTGRDRNNGLSMIIIILVSLVTWIVSSLIIRTISRYREYSAGSGVGQTTRKPASLAKALLKISGTMHKVPSKELKHIECCNAFFIIPAISGDALTQRVSTHPPIEKRVQRLLAMESAMHRY